MDEQTKAAMNAFAQQVIDAAQNAGKFASEQMPLVVQEWLRWLAVENAIWVVVSLSVLIASVYSFWAALRKLKSAPGYDAPPYVAWLIGGGIVPGVLGAVLLGVSVVDLLKVLIAPRVVVLERFMDLFK